MRRLLLFIVLAAAVANLAAQGFRERVNVAPVTSSPPRITLRMNGPIPGTTPGISVPTRVAKNASSFQGRR